jgi:hypothetical protein
MGTATPPSTRHSAQRRQEGGEGSRLGERGVVTEEGETSGLMGSAELAQE